MAGTPAAAAGHDTGKATGAAEEDRLGTPPATACQCRAAITPCCRADTAEQSRGERDGAARNEPTAHLTPGSYAKAAPVQWHFFPGSLPRAVRAVHGRIWLDGLQALEGLASEVLLDRSWEERVDCTELTMALKRRFRDCDSYLGLQDQLQHRMGALAANAAQLARRAYSDEPDSFC
ncbi:UNVERIFIED_CONTAM: hypothetical protein FKN15_040423 [Acipenser sinensis]